MPENLVYIVAFETPNTRSARVMTKMLVSSLLKNSFPGEIVVLKNFEAPLYAVPRCGLREVFIETPPWTDEEDATECLTEALAWRFRAREVIDPQHYEWILYLDADCLALRGLDHLFQSPADILVQPERGRPIREEAFNGYLTDSEMEQGNRDGINAGTFAIRGAHWHEVLARWETIYLSPPQRSPRFRDQTSWNRLLLDTHLEVRAFERGEIAFPFHPGVAYQDYRDAALVHAVGENTARKVDLLYGLYMTKFYRDDAGLFLNFLEV